MGKLGEWISQQIAVTAKDTPLGKALGYTARQWDALNQFLYDGALEIDNGLAERTIRTLAIGRKNYMFAGSDAGGGVGCDSLQSHRILQIGRGRRWGLFARYYAQDLRWLAAIEDWRVGPCHLGPDSWTEGRSDSGINHTWCGSRLTLLNVLVATSRSELEGSDMNQSVSTA